VTLAKWFIGDTVAPGWQPVTPQQCLKGHATVHLPILMQPHAVPVVRCLSTACPVLLTAQEIMVHYIAASGTPHASGVHTMITL
jgi:hypothetical protein